MRKEDKLILEALHYLLTQHISNEFSGNKERTRLIIEIDKVLNPKSQEMPFKDTLEEKPKKRKRLISKKAIKKFFDA